mgnify:CR=1 FL=1
MSEKELALSVHLAEYEQLKLEQTHRIGVRDNLIYVMLTVFGTIVSYSLTAPEHYHALLILPWAALVLGWTYLLNDKKVSEIRDYIRTILIEKINKNINSNTSEILRWEHFSAENNFRGLKKYFQLIINLIIFCFSGMTGLVLYLTKVSVLNNTMITIMLLGATAMLTLALWFIFYSDTQTQY